MAACLRPCRAPPLEASYPASVNEDEPYEQAPVSEEERALSRTKKLRSAIERSAAPGRIADYYEFRRTLGVGGYAVVKEARHKLTGERVAVKILKLPESGTVPRPAVRESEKYYTGGVEKSDLAFDDIANEIEILKALDHPAVLRMYAHYVSEHGDKVYLVTELLEGGELLDALLERGSYGEEDARTIMRPVLSGLAYLHSRGVTHRDLKLENLLLADADALASVRIADFGLAKAAFSEAPGVGGVCGTPSYLAPETIQWQPYTPAVDCWAAGVCLYILLSGVVPFNWTDRPSAKLGELFARISEGAYSVEGPEWEGVSEEAKDLVKGLMCVDPARRLSVRQALQHGWFAQSSGAAAMRISNLPAAQAKLRAFARASRARLPVVRVRAGDYVLRAGSASSDMFLICSGECEALREPPGGGAPQRLGVLGEGEFVSMAIALDIGGNRVHLNTLEEEEEEGEESPVGGNRPVKALSRFLGLAGARGGVSVRALSDVEVVVLRQTHVQGVLEKDQSVQSEVQRATDSRRRASSKPPPTPARVRRAAPPSPASLMCGFDVMVIDAGGAVAAWISGVTNALLHGPGKTSSSPATRG